MKGALVIAVVAAAPPTLAAVLTFLATRSTTRHEHEKRGAELRHSLEDLQHAIGRVERTVERVDTGVGDLRERVARLEGAREARTAAGA